MRHEDEPCQARLMRVLSKHAPSRGTGFAGASAPPDAASGPRQAASVAYFSSQTL